MIASKMTFFQDHKLGGTWRVKPSFSLGHNQEKKDEPY